MAKQRPRQSQTIKDHLASIEATLQRLTDHVACLTAALDELTDQVQWHNRNVTGDAGVFPARFRLTSMPLDPAADDWEINRVSRDDVPTDDKRPLPTNQQLLFDHD